MGPDQNRKKNERFKAWIDKALSSELDLFLDEGDQREGAAIITKQMVDKSSTLEAHSAFMNPIEKMPESSFSCKTARTAKD